MPSQWEYLLRLVLSVLAGAVIGFERELHDKPAGFRTNVLICFGATLFTIISIAMTGDQYSDRERIAAQIVTGVGFLGAGTIVHFKGNVLGLTTAATIWAVASIGMAIGAGEYLVGIVATAITAGVLFGLAHGEDLIAKWNTTTRFKIKVDGTLDEAAKIRRDIGATGAVVDDWMITNYDRELTIRFSARGPGSTLEKVQADLIAHEHVSSVKRV